MQMLSSFKSSSFNLLENNFANSTCSFIQSVSKLFKFQLLFGLLLFASVMGHVANIVTSVSAARKEFQGKFCLNILFTTTANLKKRHKRNVPPKVLP